MIDPDVLAYATLLFSTLVEAAPKDTGNLANNIVMSIVGDKVKIEISRNVSYAQYVNERQGICSRHHKSHFHWVEDTCKQVGTIYASKKGGTCKSDY